MKRSLTMQAAAIAIATVLATPAMAQDDAPAESAEGQDDKGADLSGSLDAQGVVTVRSTTLDPRYGDIDPFYGDIGAFWGDIGPFYGDIGAFYGTINPFWDDISPFYGNIGAFWGDIDPFYGKIDPFYGNIGAFFGDTTEERLQAIGQYWNTASGMFREIEGTWAQLERASGDPAETARLTALLETQMEALIALSEGEWGAAVSQQTGESFRTGFADQVLARHNIDLSDPSALAALSAGQRTAFFLDWHDSLMGFSGIDHVDHWMGGINWTPAITQIQGAQGRSVIGILDSTITGSQDLADNVVSSTGSDSFVSGHGAGVASLMVGAHDGQGVMGIAPNARVVAHNPFGADQTASWDDVRQGILALNQGGASIVNLSLGEPGVALSAEWRTIFNDAAVAQFQGSTVYVLASGNDGLAQQDDIEWNGASGTSFLLVGSVAPNGTISSFSNTPGEACLLTNGVCTGQNALLMNRFIVAPGELILVDDGFGGTVRRSGTSFAAPLVSGAIALLHDRWPWLAQHPDESVDIILRSARDLGAPGVDPVYGVGMLDVMASQSPLDFNALSFTMYQRKWFGYKASTMSAQSLLTMGVPSWWETSNVFFTLFEPVGDTYRDFAVPMSTYTKGKSTNALGGGYQRLQDFLSDRFARWILSGGKDRDGDGVLGISQLHTGVERQAGAWNVQYVTAMPQVSEEGTIKPVHAAATLNDPSNIFAFDIGFGQGAMALSGNRFGVISDYDRDHGGVNPVLGFASGEFFTSASMDVSRTMQVRLGYTENRVTADEHNPADPLARLVAAQLGEYEANAFTADIEQRLSRSISVNLQYTRLDEVDAVLGAQTGMEELLGDGSKTDAVTLSGSVAFGERTRLDLSATASRSELDEEQMLTSDNAVLGSAAQIALTHRGLIKDADTVRVAFGQPMRIEQGELELRSLGVTDRETGERGLTTQTIGIETKRRLMGEFVYASELFEGSELGLFGRYVGARTDRENDAMMIGANFAMRF